MMKWKKVHPATLSKTSINLYEIFSKPHCKNVDLLQLTERRFKQVFFCPRVQVLDFHVFNVMQFLCDGKKCLFLFAIEIHVLSLKNSIKPV